MTANSDQSASETAILPRSRLSGVHHTPVDLPTSHLIYGIEFEDRGRPRQYLESAPKMLLGLSPSTSSAHDGFPWLWVLPPRHDDVVPGRQRATNATTSMTTVIAVCPYQGCTLPGGSGVSGARRDKTDAVGLGSGWTGVAASEPTRAGRRTREARRRICHPGRHGAMAPPRRRLAGAWPGACGRERADGPCTSPEQLPAAPPPPPPRRRRSPCELSATRLCASTARPRTPPSAPSRTSARRDTSLNILTARGRTRT